MRLPGRGAAEAAARAGRGVSSGAVLVAAILAVALVGGSAFWLVDTANRQAVASRLANDAAEVSGVLNRLNDAATTAPVAVAGLVTTLDQSQLTVTTYDSFSGPLLDTDVLVALEWVPLVRAEDVETFVFNQQVNAGILDFQLVERNTAGELVPVGRRPVYYPIALAVPQGSTHEAIGQDFGAEPVRLAALELARDAGAYVATGPLTLRTLGGVGVLLVVPAYAGGIVPPEVEARRANFLGASVAIYRPQVLLERAAAQFVNADLRITLFDLGGAVGTTEADEAIVTAYQGPDGPTAGGARTLEEAETGTFTAVDFSFGGRRQRLVVQAGQAYVDAATIPTWPIPLTAGIALLAVLLYVRTRQSYEAEVASNAARLQSVLRASPDAFVGIGRDGRVVDWSDQATALFGMPAPSAFGRSVDTLLELPPEEGSGARGADRLARFLTGSDSVQLELAARRDDGSSFPTDVTVAVAPPETPWSYAVFVRDASERIRTREEVLRAREREAMADLTGRLAHDFNNLLGIIVGSIDLAREDTGEAPEVDAMLEMALNAALRGADVTRALLAVARRQALAPTDVDANDLIREMAPLLRQAVGSGVELMLDLSSRPAVCHVDTAGFTNAILNLTINASHAMPSGGTLRITTRSEDHQAVIEVTDTGTGIPPEVLERVFQPFFTTKSGGSGLGLATVEGFARQSGGAAEIESEVGVGTTVRLILPGPTARGELADAGEALAEATSALAEIAAMGGAKAPASLGATVAATGASPDGGNGAAAAGTRGARAGEKVLVVDDEAALRFMTAWWLAELGYEVRTAGSGPEGLAEALRFDPSIIVSDVIMPGPYSGLELARRARAELPGVRVLLVSGYTGGDLEGVMDEGFPLLQKPFRKAELVDRVRQLLDGSAAAVTA